MAEVGPDGAVWVIDWYNYIVQHNPTPQRIQDRQRSSLRKRSAGQETRPDLPRGFELMTEPKRLHDYALVSPRPPTTQLVDQLQHPSFPDGDCKRSVCSSNAVPIS